MTVAALQLLGAVVVALIGVGGGVVIARRNRTAQVEDRTVTETGTERQFLVEKFNELADGFETRWRDADRRWSDCEEREAALREKVDGLERRLRSAGQRLADEAE